MARRPNQLVDPAARARLRELAEQLRTLESAADGIVTWATVDGEIASWAAAALARFLDGGATTLEHAFGLRHAAHRPKENQRHAELASRVLSMKLDGKSWLEIADAMAKSGAAVTDARTLQRIFGEYEVPALIDQLGRRLVEKDQAK